MAGLPFLQTMHSLVLQLHVTMIGCSFQLQVQVSSFNQDQHQQLREAMRGKYEIYGNEEKIMIAYF